MQGFVEFPFGQDYADWSGLAPVITNFDGELFGDRNVTMDGLYTGSVKLNIWGDILYCGDNGLILWFDKNNGSLYRLDYNEKKEKICPDEECRGKINDACRHLQIYSNIYSDGYLYFTYGGYDTTDVEVKVFYNEYETRQKVIAEGVFIYRYNIESREVEKLMEFQGITGCELALNGRYLYAMTYALETSAATGGFFKTAFNITRIDLFRENAVIVYSDLMNRDDFDKISDAGDFRFIDDKIVMPVNTENTSGINICTMDMHNIKKLIEFNGNENITNIYLYAGDIYFLSAKGLCRVSIESYNRYLREYAINQQDDKKALLDSGKREVLNAGINNFCIDEDFLYYTLDGDINLYRIKLDYSRELSFIDTFKVYTPGAGEYFNIGDWKVCGGYLYAILNRGNSGWRYRQKLISENEPYLFYREF